MHIFNSYATSLEWKLNSSFQTKPNQTNQTNNKKPTQTQNQKTKPGSLAASSTWYDQITQFTKKKKSKNLLCKHIKFVTFQVNE